MQSLGKSRFLNRQIVLNKNYFLSKRDALFIRDGDGASEQVAQLKDKLLRQLRAFRDFVVEQI